VLTRPTRVLFPALLLSAAAALSACGGSSSSSSSATLGPDAVHVTGDVGTSAAVKFDGQITDQTTQTKTLVTGTGPEIADGDSVVLHTVLADGFTQKTVQNSYDQKQPSLVTITPQLPAVIHDAIAGKTVGSRVMIYTPAEKLYGGAPDPSSGIGNKDALVVLLDLVDKTLNGPDGAAKPDPAWAPKVVEKNGVVSGLDFKGTPKPDGKLHVSVLQQGTGDTVEKGQLLGVNYLGAVYRGKKPFDESYSKDPVGFPIGVGQVISGWDKALVGQKIGSRVIVEIPPKEGYADQAKPGIPANSTLYFVVDILSAD
jgi:peptidylprolyl isomerase